MRTLAATLLAIVLLTPALSADRPGPVQECRYLNQRIGFFTDQMARAEQLGDERWVARFGTHLDALVDRRAAICPGFGASEEAQAAFAELLKLGGQAALTFFTLGML